MPSTGRNIASNCCFSLAALCVLSLLSGCSLVPDIKHKPQYINPFPQLSKVAVLPFANQSEDPTLSGERVSLAYMNELQSIRGFEVLPLGVVKSQLAGYQRPLSTGADFQEFARYLGVDVVLVGSITDYDAYYPPRMTMAVRWYAANPGFHPVLPGYGLPWGTDQEEEIPSWIQYEAQRALAAEQLKSQTPELADPRSMQSYGDMQSHGGLQSHGEAKKMMTPMMPEDRMSTPRSTEMKSDDSSEKSDNVRAASAESIIYNGEGYDSEWEGMTRQANSADSLPEQWPDPRGFVPDPPTPSRPEMQAQHDAIISHMRNFNGHDEDFTKQLEEYFYFKDDARFGGWQSYLQRSEDFIRFCCHLHLVETLALRGGQDKSRLILRWPIDRYTR
ncbi:MAG: hypothetical protein Aurels2KO_36860 [Aureliella sp.]